MNARAAALLVGANALVSAALIALAYLWLVPERLPALAVLDVAELYRLKELQVAAVLVKRDASDEELHGDASPIRVFRAQSRSRCGSQSVRAGR